MIALTWIGGKLCLVLQRCNEFGDHEELDRDGDILFSLCGNGINDIADAHFLISRLQRRLTPPTLDAVEKPAQESLDAESAV